MGIPIKTKSRPALQPRGGQRFAIIQIRDYTRNIDWQTDYYRIRGDKDLT